MNEKLVAKIRFTGNNSVQKDLVGTSIETIAVDSKLNHKLINTELCKAT